MPRLTPFFAAAVLVASLAACLAAPALAQDDARVPTLTATGQGTAYAAPDIANVSFGVSSRAGTPTEALDANNADMKKVIDAAIAAGVAAADITTTAFYINPVYGEQDPNRLDQPQPIVGYEVRNEVTAKVRRLPESGAVLDQVVRAGANAVTGISFDIDNPQAVGDEATKAAVADALRKAGLLATAAGVSLGRVVSVSTAEGGGGPQPYEMRTLAAAVPVMAGQRSVTVSATVIYEIAN